MFDSILKTASKPNKIASVIRSEKFAAIIAMVVGGLIVLFVGFSPIEAVHNAAHDTRHSFAFPCH